MEIKLGSVPVQVGQAETPLLLEVFHAHVPRTTSYVVRLQVGAEGAASTWLPIVLTPGCARALAALLSLPIQTA